MHLWRELLTAGWSKGPHKAKSEGGEAGEPIVGSALRAIFRISFSLLLRFFLAFGLPIPGAGAGSGGDGRGRCNAWWRAPLSV